MSEQVWYVYQGGQQIGPFTSEQLNQMHTSKMVALDAYLFKTGWKDWRPLEECIEEAGLNGKNARATEQRKLGTPRATIQGRVVVHNNGQLVIGAGVNISATGIFVETRDQIFNMGEKLKISVRAEGLTRPFNVVAKVIRYNTDTRFPIGYGLQFEGLEDSVRNDVQGLVDRQNAHKVSDTKKAQ